MKEDFKKVKKLIDKYQNIKLLPSPLLEKDTFPAALALLYSLRKLGKNVKLISARFPEKFNFLVEEKKTEENEFKKENPQIPEANFLISIKELPVKLSQIYYEKTAEGLNLYLKTKNGELKEENVTFKPLKSFDSGNLLITLGIRDFKEVKELLKENKGEIINIDRNPENKEYGNLNLIEPSSISFSEIIFDILNSLNENLFDINVSKSLLAGIILGTSNFQENKLNPEVFQKISFLMKKGANFHEIISNLYRLKNENSFRLFKRVLNKLKISNNKSLGWVTISDKDFRDTCSFPSDLPFTLENLTSQIFPFRNFLCLWENKSSPINVWGVFYSPNKKLTKKISEELRGKEKGDAVFFRSQDSNIESAEEKILEIINQV